MSKPKSGSMMGWNDIQQQTEHLHAVSVKYLADVWSTLRDRIGNPTTWGDEIEYQILGLDPEKQEAHLSMKGSLLVEKLANAGTEIDWQPEYTEYMVECAPAKPYYGYKNISQLERKLNDRREAIKKYLEPNEAAFSLSLFPLLDIPEVSKALEISPEDHDAVLDKAIAPVERYQILRKNLVSRSGRKFHSEVPIFLDTRTLQAIESGANSNRSLLTRPNERPSIVLEDILFAMGGCGLQVTFQTSSLLEIRRLHDQLCVLGPLLLSLTAATPIYKGMLVDTDTRWTQACNIVDDRTAEEIRKLTARWSASPMYLSPEIEFRAGVSPSDVERHSSIEAQLKDSGLDPMMAIYFANLHLRDPLVLRGDDSAVTSMSDAEVHESICGTVWSHVRLKIPRAHLSEGDEEEAEGWKVELRPMEVQLTDFSNAAFLIFAQLLRDVLPACGLDLYMPMSSVRENMDRAHAKDSVLEEKFWFPRNPYRNHRQDNDLVLMSMDEIINGSNNSAGAASQNSPSGGFQGMIPIIKQHIEPSLYQEISKYLQFIGERASGAQPTPATWQRNFVRNHPDYSQDSIVTPRIAYDMLSEIRLMD